MTKYLQKDQSIKDLQPGRPVASLFVIAQARQGQARNGPFWALTLADATGRADAKIWSPASQDYPALAAGMVARVEGVAQTYKDQVQVNVDRLTIIDPTCQGLDMSRLVPSSGVPPHELYGRLMDLCMRHLTHPAWVRLARSVLEDETVKRRLMAAPGAKNVHHAYMGGLLEHTLSVAGLCMKFCDHYPELDRQTLLAAAVFHDLGKAWELSGGLANDYTDVGRLIGHITLGLEVLAPFLARAALAPELALHLKHIILSHHGEYAFGSPRRPKTAEAMALHYADNLDAKMNQVAGVFAEMAAQGAENNGEADLPDGGAPDPAEGQWSAYQRTLERYLFNPRRTPGGAAQEPKAWDGADGGPDAAACGGAGEDAASRAVFSGEEMGDDAGMPDPTPGVCGNAGADDAFDAASDVPDVPPDVPDGEMENGAAPWDDVPLEAYADAAGVDAATLRGDEAGGNGLSAEAADAARAFFATPPWEDAPLAADGGNGSDASPDGDARRKTKIRVDQCSLLSKG